MHLKPGTLLQSGKYRIVRFINSGGFGCTYEAVHTSLDDRFAIKEFFVKDFCNRDENTSYVTVGTNSKKALVEKLKNKFINEAKSIRKLHHNGIVKVSDVFEENGTAYYVMDYIEGRSLSQLIDEKGRLTEAEALRYIRRVSETLKYVHSKGMLHLDIKPGNIMIDEEDNPILIDFGTSKQYDEESGENTSTLLGKTPGYAPLEQMDNSVQEFYPATDIYALGATMYKMLTGITPPNAIKRASGTKLEPLPSNISEGTRNAIETSLNILVENRPQSIEEFLKALEFKEVTEGEGTDIIEIEVGSEPPVPTPRPKNWVLYVVVAILLGVAGYFMHDSKEKKEYESMLSDNQSYITLIGEGDKLLRDNKYSESINKYEQAHIYEKKYTGTEYSKEFDKGASAKISEAKARLEKERKEREGIYEVNGVTFKMIAVEGGTFKMGATSEQGSDAYSDERPVHSVTLSDYYIGETEVTQELWDAVMGTSPSAFKGSSKRPMESVSWDDCWTFINELNRLTGKNFRLPTEAEWEYAARGGNKSKGYKYSGSNTIGNVAWYTDNSGNKTHDVKTKQANELGIYDMSGNVEEWCQDYYGNYSSSSQTNPTGPSSGSYRVSRGGSYYYNADCCRVSYRRDYSDPYRTSSNLGLRLSLSLD